MTSNCTLNIVNGSFNILYTVVTDTNRILIIDVTTPWYLYFLENALNFDNAVLPVLLFIIALNLAMPIICTMLDKSSYTQLTEGKETHGVDKDFLR